MLTMLRDLLRQRFRTLLTVSGVALGIFTLIVLGAVGENFRRVIDEAKGYTGGLVRLITKTNSEGTNPGITPEDLRTVRALPGVRSVNPSLLLFLDGFDLQSDPLQIVRPKALVEGLPAAEAELTRGGGVDVLKGRWLREGDDRHAMVVDWLARRRNLKIGEPVRIRHKDYEVVAIYHGPDTPVVPAAIVPYQLLNDDLVEPAAERAQRFFRGLAENPLLAPFLPPQFNPAALDPLAREFAHEQSSLFRVYEVVPIDRSFAGTQEVAERLREALPDLAVIDPQTLNEGMEKAMALVLVITLFVTVISTVVGGLLIVNTMAMAVIERRREIGIKAALGATPGQIALEFVVEAALLATVGALVGIAMGVVAILVCEPMLLDRVETNNALFFVTPRLIAFALLYSLTMGVLAGGIPAARAARIDPAVCLREL